jgi:hypothetical protein
MDNAGRLKLADRLDEMASVVGIPDHYEELLLDAADAIRALVRHVDIVATDRRVERKMAFDAAVRRQTA